MRIRLSIFLVLGLIGCQSVPKDLFSVSSKTVERRQIEMRKYSGIKEEDLLSACSAIVQDLGFTLEGSESKLGLLTANKNRDAVDGREVAAAIVIALLGGGNTPISRDQHIRVSIVSMPTADKAPDSWVVRATFQRVVTRTDNSVFTQTLTDPQMHVEFFDKLSKAVFLEGQKL